MRDNATTIDDSTATIEVDERPQPRPAPGIRAVRDPLEPESVFQRWWKPVLIGVFGAFMIAAAAELVMRELPFDQIMNRNSAGQEPGVTSVPRVDGTMSVRTVPAGATISLNSESAGRTPMLDRQLALGTHMVSIRMDGFSGVDTLVTVRAGDEHDMVFALRPVGYESGVSAPALDPADDGEAAREAAVATSEQPASPATEADASPAVREGRVTILTEPAGAVVRAGGRRLGTTPLSNVPLKAGAHELTFALPDHDSAARTVSVRAGEETTVSLSMEAQRGQVRVLVLPWGSISVNGELHAEDTDLRHVFDLPAGSHTIRGYHPVLGTVDREVRVIAGESIDVVIDLNQ